MQDEAGITYHMKPTWVELVRVTKGLASEELDRRLSLPHGTVKQFLVGPVLKGGRYSLALDPDGSLIKRIYREVGEQEPEVMLEMRMKLPNGEWSRSFVSHIGVRPSKRIPAPPSTAATFPPVEHLGRDEDGVQYRMVPVWLELRRALSGADLAELDRQLSLAPGTTQKYLQGPILKGDNYDFLAPPDASVVYRLYDAVGRERPPMLTDMQMRRSGTKDWPIKFVSHIGVPLERRDDT